MESERFPPRRLSAGAADDRTHCERGERHLRGRAASHGGGQVAHGTNMHTGVSGERRSRGAAVALSQMGSVTATKFTGLVLSCIMQRLDLVGAGVGKLWWAEELVKGGACLPVRLAASQRGWREIKNRH